MSAKPPGLVRKLWMAPAAAIDADDIARPLPDPGVLIAVYRGLPRTTMNCRFTRQELYDLVWSEPVRTIAPRFGISDVALAKNCRKQDIPMPPRGYWAKLQAGKKTTRQTLPPRGVGKPEVIHFGPAYRWGYQFEPKDLINSEIPPPPEFPELVAELTQRVRKLVGKVTVPRDFTRAHRHVARLLEEDEARRAKQLASRYPLVIDAPLFESPFERRRLRLVSAIFVALERCGMTPSLDGKNPSEFYVRVGGQDVSFKARPPQAAARQIRAGARAQPAGVR